MIKDLRGKKVVVIDDESELAELMGELLADSGMDVRIFDDPVRALEVLKKEAVDLVISDLKMPRLSGVQVFEEIHRMRPHDPCRFVLISGGVLNEREFAHHPLKIDGFISKPYTEEQFLEVVRNCF